MLGDLEVVVNPWKNLKYVRINKRVKEKWLNVQYACLKVVDIACLADTCCPFSLGVWSWLGFPRGSMIKKIHLECRRHRRCRFDPWVGKIPWKRAWQPSPVFLPGQSHELRSLAGYGP